MDFLDPISMKPFLDSFPVRIVTEFKTVEYNKHAVRELAKQFGGKQFNSREYYEVFEFPHEDPATQFVGACQKLPDFKTASMKRLPPRLESSD